MKIAIIGGGITGLVSAYRLSKAGCSVTLIEKSNSLGGLAWGFKEKNWKWHLEGAYHHLFTNDDEIINLSKELGIKLIYKRPITANYHNGNILQMDSPLNFLLYKHLSIISKLRTGILIALIKSGLFFKFFERNTAENIFIKVGGNEAWSEIWQKLLYGKFGNYAQKISGSWLWARIKKRTSNLVYIYGGFNTLVEKLESECTKYNARLFKNYNITDIEMPKNSKTNNPNKFRIKLNNKYEYFEKILFTIPTQSAIKLIPKIDKFYKTSLTIPHLSAQTLILESTKPILENVYWLNILDSSYPFLACVSHTNFMDKSNYGNNHLTYFGNYLDPRHKFFNMTKIQILNHFMPFIKQINPNFDRSTIKNIYLFNGHFAQPIHLTNYKKYIPQFKSNIEGIYLTNMDSIYPWDRGTNYAVNEANKAVANILGI